MAIQDERPTRANENNKDEKEVLKVDKEEVNDKTNKGKMYILYTNADSLANKREELNTIIKNMGVQPHIIIITEVKSKNNWNMKLSEFNIDGYCLISNDLDMNKRGIIIYMKRNIKFTVFDCEINFEEFILIKLKLCSGEEFINAVYRSPHINTENDIKMLKLIKTINETYKMLLALEISI